MDKTKLVLDDVSMWLFLPTKTPDRNVPVSSLKIKHSHFQHLLSLACVIHNHGEPLSAEDRRKPVRVQWDPERSPSLQVLPYRSIQIGISGKISQKWAETWIVGIEDVTEKAKGLKEAVESGVVDVEELVEKDLVPKESVYDISDTLREALRMN